MWITLREYGSSYGTYQFGYTLWAEREADEPLDDIYARGFLPYSSDPAVKETHYMARSARVRLADFALTSENRRIKTKFAEENLVVDEVPVSSLMHDEAFLTFCLDYFESRHGAGVFSKERLMHVLTFSNEIVVLRYRHNDAVAAYIIERRGASMHHYWFSFYDMALANKSFGSYLMLDAIERAKEGGAAHMYLGTVYGAKALYKANYEPLEFWDGTSWNEDTAKLKELARNDPKN